MDLNKLITKRINEYALNGDANLLEQYGFLITMIAKEYAAEQLILSGVSNRRKQLIDFLDDVLMCQDEGATIVDREKYVDGYLGN
jgi:hypothetical protein